MSWGLAFLWAVSFQSSSMQSAYCPWLSSDRQCHRFVACGNLKLSAGRPVITASMSHDPLSQIWAEMIYLIEISLIFCVVGKSVWDRYQLETDQIWKFIGNFSSTFCLTVGRRLLRFEGNKLLKESFRPFITSLSGL